MYFEKKNNDKIVSYIWAKEYYNEEISKEKGVMILDIFTVEEYRGKGFATELIKELINKLTNTKYTKYIILDDCTGVLPPHNLYYKLSFMVRDFSKNDRSFKKWELCDDPDEERILFINKVSNHN